MTRSSFVWPLSMLFLGALSMACASDPPDRSVDNVVEPDAGTAPDTLSVEAAPIDTGRSSDAQNLEGVLIDDFEDGDNKALYLKGVWYSYDDKSNGGGSSISYTGVTGTTPVMGGPGYESTRSLEVTYSFDQGTLAYTPYVGWGVYFGDATTPIDISQFVGLAYTYKGGAHRVRFETFEIKNYDYWGTQVAASTSWKTVIVPFAQLNQEGFGARVPFNPKNLGNVSFQARGATGAKGQLDIDNLMFLTRPPEQTLKPDMVVNPAQPPADEAIDSIAITHPAQARARAYLNRGYNITNWLEQERFNGTFTYDEAFVGKLAAAGFKSLRLPVDLDRYVVSTTGTGGAMEVEVSDDLYTMLDSFVAWTAKAGISLTIDYHQYDKSINKAKSETLDKAVAVWGKVAARYAANPREDLFYELLNEPELSLDGTPLTQIEWTALAERMIAAIRKSDTVHSILFGDVDWYGISALSQRKPLSDANVIYVIHDYEPFIFTHQGASWADMGSTHDLPYPYDPKRWSPYYGVLGFNTSMPSWILQAAQNYFRTGNRASVRNKILEAKRWAVTNNVPVTCNEFGAYDGTSKLEDRARYLTDIISIFEELEIPWQQWFMIMDKDGTVAPEIRTAMRLGQ